MSTYNNSALTYDAGATSYDGDPGAIAGLPQCVIEIGFNDGPYVSEPAWTDVTEYVRSVTVRRGRSDDLSPFVGTATVELDNRARTFDPFNAGTTRTNLITNPSFETGTASWTTQGGATVARISTDKWVGAYCAQVTSSATNYNNIITGFIPVTSNTAYTLSAYAKNVSGNTRTVYVAIQWFTSAGVYISETNSGSQGTLAAGSAWTIRNCTGTAPATATQAKVVLLSGTTGLSAGWLTNWDGVLFEQASSVGSYFDGSTIADGNILTQQITAWTGTSHASTSTLGKFPRQTQLVPRRQIRIRAAAGASTYPVFRGYIAGWPVSYTDAGFDSTVTVECFDALAFVAAETTPDTWLSDYTLSLSPSHYYKFDDALQPRLNGTFILTTPFKDSGSDPIDYQFGTDQLRAGGQLIDGAAGSIDVSVGSWQAEKLRRPLYPSIGSMSVSAFIRFSNNDSGGFIAANDNAYMTIQFEKATNNLIVRITKGTGANDRINYTLPGVWANDQAYHIAVTYNASSGASVLYVDGVASTVSPTTSVGSDTGEYQIAIVDGCNATEFSVYRSVLTAAQVLLLSDYGRLSLLEQIPSRLTRIFRATPFLENASPSGDFNIWEAPLATQFVQGLQSDNPISSELAVLNSGEGGELFTSREGVIYLTGRDTQNYSSVFLPYDPVTPQVTFSDQAGTALLPFGPSLDVEYNADDIINDLSVTFTGGGSIVVSDTDSINENGKRSATITTSLTGPTGAGSPQDLAANRLEYFRHVIPKVSPVDVGMTRRLTDWQRILDLELMDCFSVQRTPSVGSALDFRLLVQAIEHQIIPGDWRVRITGSARYSNWFTADVDSADGDRLAV